MIDELLDNGDAIALRDAIGNRSVSVVDVVGACLQRIETRDGETNAVIATNPRAIECAEALDRQLAQGDAAGTMTGLPVLVKDNIETADQPTTAGSTALEGNITGRDAPIIAQLRRNGAIILGKANLSEWANFRSRRSSSGWSAVGGQTTNAHDPTRSPCGSSSGSAVAVAARLAPLAIGTETNGSVICPAHVNGVVGIKPTVGVLSADRIIPISHTQDTAGPLAATVAGAALLMNGMQANTNYLRGLEAASFSGKRIGIVRSATGYHDGVDAVFDTAVARIRDAGAIIVDGLRLDAGYDGFRRDTFLVLLYEFKHDLNAYLASLPNELSSMTLKQLIEYNESRTDTEMVHFPQDIFLRAQNTDDKSAYLTALERVQNAARRAIDDLLTNNQLNALIAPTGAPAWKIDHVAGDHSLGSFAMFPAVACYPHVTVPMGGVRGLPVGLSLAGTRNDDQVLMQLGHAFEQLLD